MGTDKSSPRRAGKVAVWIIAIVAALIIVIFVGRNIWHGQAQERSNPAEVDPQDRPHSSHDLTVDPPTGR